MERETTTLQVQNHSFVVKTYATARETNQIQSAYAKAVNFAVEGDKPKIQGVDPAQLYNVQLEMVRQLVVEMDDDKQKIVERCEDLPNDIFQDLSQQLDDLVAKKKS